MAWTIYQWRSGEFHEYNNPPHYLRYVNDRMTGESAEAVFRSVITGRDRDLYPNGMYIVVGNNWHGRMFRLQDGEFEVATTSFDEMNDSDATPIPDP